MATKYIAKLDGKIVGKRATRDRTYTHAIVVRGHGEAEPHVASWAGRPDLAQREAARQRSYYPHVWVVEAEVVS